MNPFARPLFVLLLAALVGCGGSDSDPPAGTDTDSGVGDVAEADPGESTVDPGPSEDDVGAATDPGPGDLEDVADESDPGTEADTGATDEGESVDEGPPPPLPELPTQAPLSQPDDLLDGAGVESCAVYLDERCEAGRKQACAIYDADGSTWVDDPEPLLRRVYLYDRWRDLHNSPDGQAIDRDFSVEIMPGTPEAEWSSMESFSGYWGTGDGGIWTGWSTVASILRYSQTGTEADYERMEQQVRDMVTMYEVTGIPGYLCRYHYIKMPEGGPKTDDHIQRWEGSYNPGHHHRLVVAPETIENLPSTYTEGVPDENGVPVVGTPMWQGRPSIDQNTGPMTSLPMAYDLLRDDALKEKIAHHLTCYLKRLQRIELINLQDNTELLDTLTDYFAAGELNLDPGDIDLTQTNRIVGYVHRQINTKNEESYEMGCPDTVQLEPWRVIDASKPGFIVEMLSLVQDMDTDAERPQTIDHYYFPTFRGGDAMHLMHLATIAYHFTGDEMYRRFLFEELIGDLDTQEVIHTAGAFDLPKYCKKHFGDQITFGPWWAFLHLIGESDLKVELEKAYHTEFWEKLMGPVENVDFEIFYAGAVRPEIATDRDFALQRALENLATMGGNGGALMGDWTDPQWLDDPRRTYSVTEAQQLDAAGEGTTAVCPTEAEVDICTAEISFGGVELPPLNGWRSGTCTGSEWECPLEEDQCTRKMSSHALPLPVRPHTDYLWQRNPFSLGRSVGTEGHRQFAGSDYSVPYWNARRYGFITEGAKQALAWRDMGECEAETTE